MNHASKTSVSTYHSTKDNTLSLSIDTIFTQSEHELSTEIIKKFLDKAISKIKDNNTDPNRLVRVVSKGKVLWMTIDQANEYLINNEDPDLKKPIEDALHGDISNIKNEIKFLLALSYYTLEQYHSQDSISVQDFNQLIPALSRQEEEINKNLDETIEFELILKEKLNNLPLIDQYEQLMAKFIELKDKTGYQKVATAIADQLKKHKSNYLRYARAIEPDLQRVYQGRVNLQMSKKNILQTQNNIISFKQANLRLEIEKLKEKLILLNQSNANTETNTVDVSKSNLNQDQSTEYNQTKKNLTKKEEEHKALHLSDKIIRQQQKTISNVVRTILKDVFNSDEPIMISAHPIDSKAESPTPNLDSNTKKIKQGMYYNKK